MFASGVQSTVSDLPQVGGLGVAKGHGSVHPSAAAGHKDREEERDDHGISSACCLRWLVEHNSWCHNLNQSSTYN